MATTLACARHWLLILLCSSSSATAFADQEQHTLRYRFTPGDSVYFISRNETQRRYMVNAREIATNDSVDALKHYRVLSVTSDGGAELELMIDRTRMSVDDGSSLFVYDSTRDKDPPDAFQAVHGTVGRPWLRVTVNSLGEATNYHTPGGTAVPESADYVSRVLPVLPQAPVAIGGTWKEPFTIDVSVEQINVAEGQPLKRPVKMQRVYTLESVENGIATLGLRTEVLTPRRTPKQDVELIQRQFSGSITIDIANGRLLGRELNIDGNVVGYDGPMSVMSVKMAQKDEYAPAGLATVAEPQPTAMK